MTGDGDGDGERWTVEVERVKGERVRDVGSGFRVQGSGLRDEAAGLGLKGEGLGHEGCIQQGRTENAKSGFRFQGFCGFGVLVLRGLRLGVTWITCARRSGSPEMGPW